MHQCAFNGEKGRKGEKNNEEFAIEVFFTRFIDPESAE
jgi:hypothetical protein